MMRSLFSMCTERRLPHRLPFSQRLNGARRFFCLLLFTSAFGFTAKAAVPAKISFQNILENKDTTVGEGSSFLQDHEGFMWIGGGAALFRYDAYEFRQMDFLPDQNRPDEKEAVRYAGALFEDSHNQIWVGSRNGLLKFDRTKDRLIRISNLPEPAPKISAANVIELIELGHGTLLAATNIGLFALYPDRSNSDANHFDRLNYELIRPTPVNTLLVDGKNIWVGSDAGLERFDWSSRSFIEYPMVNGQEGVPIDRHVGDITSDRNGKLWIATSGGLVHYDTENKQWRRYRNNPADHTSISSNDVWRVLLDSQGILWAATDGGGLVAFDQEHDRFISYKFEAGRIGSLNSNTVRSIYEDHNHDLWVGNYPVGVNFFDRSSAAFTSYANEPNNPNSLSNNSVSSVQEDKDGNLWLGTGGGGLNYLNRKTGEFTHFKSNPSDASTISGNSVTSTFIDSEGIIWTGCWAAGISSYDPVAKRFTRYPFDPTRIAKESIGTSDRLNGSSVWFIKEDKNHNMWFATHTSGISKMDRATKRFTHYTNNPSEPKSLSHKLVWTIFEDSKDNFWIGTTTGLNLMDREHGTFTRFLSDPKDPTTLSNSSATTLYEDSKGRLWIGTDAGLNRFNPESKTFTRYTRSDGLINDHIRKILEDGDGNLWISTDNGFFSFNPDTLKIRNRNRIAGRLVGGFFTKSGLISRSGEVIFGGAEGLRIFDPKALTDNSYVPPVVLTDLKVFSESIVLDGPDGILQRPINLTDKIVLDYKNTNLAFKYSALSFREPDKNLYSYKLEGFDPNWSVPGPQRETKYTNLDPGEYLFRVKASNNDGLWNEMDKSITIIQQTPPWNTVWAFVVYALGVLCLLLVFLRRQRASHRLMQEHNRKLEISVAERTVEVLEKSKNIEIMLSNIPQGIFTVQNDGRIHPEYSAYLETIFETHHIAGRELGDFLFSGAKLESGALKPINSAIFSIIGEDAINFEFNRSKLPDEYEIHLGKATKFLSLDWNPIIENGLVSRLMVSVRDVSHVKQIENDLIQSEKLAALGALVAGVAHELNTPIGNGLTVASTLRECCQAMKRQMQAGLTKTVLERFVNDMDEGTLLVNRNLERASELVSSFRQVAMDRTSAQRRKFSLKEIISEICLTTSPAFKRTPYVVDVVITQDITLDSYPGPLGQVITNLLNNTIIHAFDGRDHGRVVLSSKNVIGGVEVSVTDDGLGIAPEHLEKIYDPFFTTKLGSGGNGLGMHIVHNIVTSVLGGNIDLISELGKGTCFTLFLPKTAPVTHAAHENEIPR